MIRTTSYIVLVSLALGVLALLQLSRVAQASGVVTNCSDDTDFSNKLAGGGTVTFNCGTATIVLKSTKTIASDTTIDGGGKITLSGDSAVLLFSVNAVEFTLKNIVLERGYGGTGNGGAINNFGRLILENATIRDSTDSSFKGGAIFSMGPIEITKSTLTNNKAGTGGAIYVEGSGLQVSIDDSTITGNSTTGNGGGIYSAFATITLTNVTLSGNTANWGGGIFNADGSTAILTNVTLSGNQASNGAAIYTDAGSATLTNVTVSGNSASSGAAIVNAGSTTLKNTLVAHGSQGANCDSVSGGGFNLSDDLTCGFGVGRVNVNLHLGPLANNGGFTQTHLPQTGSPAIDNGTFVLSILTDQRGVTRPQGAAFDVGSVEVIAATPTPTRTSTHTATPSRTPTKTPTKTATPGRTPTRTATTAACVSKPSKPMLIRPRNAKKVRGPTIKLDWDDTHCAQTFKVILKLDSSKGARFQKKRGLTKSEFVTKPLSQGQTYAWRVIALNSLGRTKSDWRTLTVK